MPLPVEVLDERPSISLRQRLLLAILAPLMLVFAISVFLDYRLAKETADAAFDQSLADAALDIAAHIQTGESQVSVKLSSEAEAMLRSDGSDKIYFAVRDGSGHLLAGDADLPDLRLAAQGQPEFKDTRFRGAWIRSAVQRIDSPLSEITITVAETLSKRNRASRKVLTAMILPNLIVIVATFLAVYVGVRKGLAPLAALEREIATRSPSDLREINVQPTPREIWPMLSRLNEQMCIRDRYEGERFPRMPKLPRRQGHGPGDAGPNRTETTPETGQWRQDLYRLSLRHRAQGAGRRTGAAGCHGDRAMTSPHPCPLPGIFCAHGGR